jgi:hypothetical protein
MGYTFATHLHNYACWTAARAVQRNFTTTEKIIKAIEASDLMRVEELQIETVAEYDKFHKTCCNQIIDFFKNQLNTTASYGRAAKIVAIYLKTAVIVRYSGEGKLAEIAHPPIDRILLTNLRKHFPQVGNEKINWTELNENGYFDLITKLRTLPFEKFWQLEEYWSAADEKTYSVAPNRGKIPA